MAFADRLLGAPSSASHSSSGDGGHGGEEPRFHYTQNNKLLGIYDDLMALVRELKSDAAQEPTIEAAFEALLREYKRATSPPGTTNASPGAAYVRAFNAGYYK